MGTEDPKLLLQEYHNVKTALKDDLGEACSAEQARQASQYREMLSKRDAYIGRRIGHSLQPGRTGLLFLGMMHNVESFLPEDMVVRRLVPPISGPGDKAASRITEDSKHRRVP